MTLTIVWLSTFTTQQTISSILLAITAEVFIRLAMFRTFNLENELIISYTLNRSSSCMISWLTVQIIAVISDKTSLYFHLCFCTYKPIPHKITFILMATNDQMPQIIKNCFFIASWTHYLILLFKIIFRILMSEIGLYAVEARVMFTPKVDGF